MKLITHKAHGHLLAGYMVLTCLGTTLSLIVPGTAQPSDPSKTPNSPNVQPTALPEAAPPQGVTLPPVPVSASPAPAQQQASSQQSAPPYVLPLAAPAPQPELSSTAHPVVLPPVPKAATTGRSTRAVSTISGQGTTDNLAKFTGSNAIGNSVLVEKSGRIGLGTTSPPGLFSVVGNSSTPSVYSSNAGTGIGVQGISTSGIGVQGDTNSTSNTAAGVLGRVNPTSPGIAAAGVRGISQSTNTKGFGVYGSHAGGGAGVYGTAVSGSGVYGTSAQGMGVRGSYTGTSGTNPGVMGETSSTADNATGVLGVVSSSKPGGFSAGVRGINNGTSGINVGVYGSQAGSGIGVYGIAPDGYGVYGSSQTGRGVYAQSLTGDGVYTQSNNGYGVRSFSDKGEGVYGSSNGGYGVHGYSYSTAGVYGEAYSNPGVSALSTTANAVSGTSTDGAGIYGYSGNSFGVHGVGRIDSGVKGESSSAPGVTGVSTSNVGVSATSTDSYAMQAISTNSIGLYAETKNASKYAGYFKGNVYVSGNLSKASGSFKIDNPLHPATQYLSHSFVESPDMMNVYNGNVALDKRGQATITLPDYFQALNRDFRYQLTPIGAPASLYVAKEISGNHFSIAGGKAGLKVSWQVTGIRNDAYARDHRIPTEETKALSDQGKYLYPAGFGAGQDKLIEPNGTRLVAR